MTILCSYVFIIIFFFWLLLRVSLLTGFQQLIIKCFDVFFLFILLGVHGASKIYDSIVFIKFGNICCIVFSNTALSQGYSNYLYIEVKVKVAQSCLSLWLHGLYSPWNSPFHGQNTGVGSLSLLQRIFPTQGSNPGLPHCRQILYQLNYKGSPIILEWVAYPFSRGSSQPRNRTGVSCIAGRFFTNWAISEAWEEVNY